MYRNGNYSYKIFYMKVQHIELYTNYFIMHFKIHLQLLHTNTRTRARTHARTHTCMHACTRAHTHAHTHTHTHTQTQTHICSLHHALEMSILLPKMEKLTTKRAIIKKSKPES